jgi:hypothetical protein
VGVRQQYQTILHTNTRRAAFAVNTPLQGLFSGFSEAQPNPFLPRVGYTFERVRASADFIPIGGGFDQPGAIPDQANIVQSFAAEWQVKEIRLGYRLNHSLQDNRAVGRERADLRNFTHNATVGWSPLATLELNLDLNFEDANNRELSLTDRTLRFGGAATWQATKRQTFNLTLSTVGAGDLARTTRNFNNEFDLQWSYRLTRENENRFKKVQANYFISLGRGRGSGPGAGRCGGRIPTTSTAIRRGRRRQYGERFDGQLVSCRRC